MGTSHLVLFFLSTYTLVQIQNRELQTSIQSKQQENMNYSYTRCIRMLTDTPWRLKLMGRQSFSKMVFLPKTSMLVKREKDTYSRLIEWLHIGFLLHMRLHIHGSSSKWPMFGRRKWILIVPTDSQPLPATSYLLGISLPALCISDSFLPRVLHILTSFLENCLWQ